MTNIITITEDRKIVCSVCGHMPNQDSTVRIATDDLVAHYNDTHKESGTSLLSLSQDRWFCQEWEIWDYSKCKHKKCLSDSSLLRDNELRDNCEVSPPIVNHKVGSNPSDPIRNDDTISHKLPLKDKDSVISHKLKKNSKYKINNTCYGIFLYGTSKRFVFKMPYGNIEVFTGNNVFKEVV